MKKIFFICLLFISSLFADFKSERLSQKLLDSKIPIIDIRTPDEWKQTGIIKGSITLMFFNEKGAYDLNSFITELNKKIDTTKPFALICRTGNRTKRLSTYLAKKFNYKVTNITGGIMYPQMKNPPFVSYK